MGTLNFIKQAAHPAQARVLGARPRQRTSMAEKARKTEWQRCGPRLLARTSYLSSSRVAPRLQCVACRLGGIWLQAPQFVLQTQTQQASPSQDSAGARLDPLHVQVKERIV